MKKHFLLLLAICLLSIGVKAQTVSMHNFTVNPSSVPLNGLLSVDYDLYNNGPGPISGAVNSHLSVNGVNEGVKNTFNITGSLLPGQFVHISFNMAASTSNGFQVQPVVVIVIWPTGNGFTNSENEGTATVNVTQ